MSETLQTTLAEFEKGDEITFNDRVQPLTVVSTYESYGTVSVRVEGPRGGHYRLSTGERRDAEVKRDAETVLDKSDWEHYAELESVELATPAAEVEPPVEVGDAFKRECTLDCVDYTGEFDAYRVVGIDRDEQQVDVEIVASAGGVDTVDVLTLHYQDLEDRLEKWDQVEDLLVDDDVELEDGREDGSCPECGTDAKRATVVRTGGGLYGDGALLRCRDCGREFFRVLGDEDRADRDDRDDGDRELVADGRGSAIDEFAAYISGVLELDARASSDSSAAVVEASRSAVEDAQRRLEERGYSAFVAGERLFVVPSDADLRAVREAHEDGGPEAGEMLEVEDPVDRDDGGDDEDPDAGGSSAHAKRIAAQLALASEEDLEDGDPIADGGVEVADSEVGLERTGVECDECGETSTDRVREGLESGDGVLLECSSCGGITAHTLAGGA